MMGGLAGDSGARYNLDSSRPGVFPAWENRRAARGGRRRKQGASADGFGDAGASAKKRARKGRPPGGCPKNNVQVPISSSNRQFGAGSAGCPGWRRARR